MKSSLQAKRTAAGLFTLLLLVSTAFAQNNPAAYQPPEFYALSGGAAAAGMPAMPASPLAGGVPAAQGGEFVDVHGNPIVMPASYCEGSQGGCYDGCPGGCYEGCPGGCPSGYACGPGGTNPYDSGMAVDFGGYGADQCGPHYFDVSADMVFLHSEEMFEGILPFTSEGVGALAPKYNDPSGAQEYEPGWRIAFRYDLGPLSLFEATYMGLYEIDSSQQVNSLDVTDPQQNFQLFSVFSDYGTGTLIPGVDDGSTHFVGYESDLQSTELTYRHYWVGFSPRITGTLLVGFRYLRLTEDLSFNTTGLVTGQVQSVEPASRLWSSENDLVGAQIGGDGWICLRQGLRFGGEVKAGLYNNRYSFLHAADVPEGFSVSDFSVMTQGNRVAFAGEASLNLVADILPSLSIRGGYQLLYMNSLATAANNVDTSDYFSTAVLSQSDALYHGFNGGVEYVW